jgi:peptide deformylase
MKTIVQKDKPVLREKAKIVNIPDITSPYIQNIIKEMSRALATQDDGIALAAPQIGESLQIFIISDSLMAHADPDYKKTGKDLVFINPEITKRSKDTTLLEEGCLSVRWFYGMVKRHNKVSLKAYNEKGDIITRGASGLLAQIFQHETDHLNGVLFTDKADEIWEMSEEEAKKQNRSN